MGIDLKKGKPGLDLQKKPAFPSPAAGSSKGLDLKKGKPGLDLQKKPAPVVTPGKTTYGKVPPKIPINGKDKEKGKGKWAWLLLLIPIAAITWAVWPKTGQTGTTETNNGQEVASNVNGDEAVTPGPGTEPVGKTGTQNSAVPESGTTTQTPTAPAAGEGTDLDSQQPSSPAGTRQPDGTTAKVADKKTTDQARTEPAIKDYSSYTQNRAPVKQDAIKQVLQFGFNDRSLDAADKAALDKFIANFPKDSASTIRIDGYACNIGPEAANFAVAQERAISVQNYLKNNGIGAKVTILVSSFGSQNPAGDNITSQGRARNRRVAISYE